MTMIRKEDLRICMSCEMLHTSQECPHCAKGPSFYIKPWLDEKLAPLKWEKLEEGKDGG